MNKKGNIYLNVGIGIFLWITGVLVMPFLADSITNARTNLGCSTLSALTSGTKLVCIGISGVMPYFILFLIAMVGGFLIGENM